MRAEINQMKVIAGCTVSTGYFPGRIMKHVNVKKKDNVKMMAGMIITGRLK